MKPWVECPNITINLDLPMRTRYADVPQSELDRGARLLAAVMSEVPERARYLADFVRLRTLNRFHAEIVTLANRIGANWREVMIANLTYDLVMTMFGCSTVALATPKGPVLARNMDFWPEDVLAQTSALIHMNRGGKLALANAGWPGTVGVVTGMSSRGFAIALNAVSCSEPSRKTGYPVLLYLRKVFDEAANFSQAVTLLTKQKLASPCLITIVGTENHQRVVLERTPTRCALRKPKGDSPLVTTNDYRLLKDTPTESDNELYQTACCRFDSLTILSANHDASKEVSDDELLYCLTDPGVLSGITAQHIIMRPSEQKIRMFVPRRFVPDGFN